MIKKYGKVIIEEDTITITGFEFDCEGTFDAMEWAKKRLAGKTSRVIEEGKKQGGIVYPKGTPGVLPCEG